MVYTRGVKLNPQRAAVSAGFCGFLSISCQLRPADQGVSIILPINDLNEPRVLRTTRIPADIAALQDWSLTPVVYTITSTLIGNLDENCIVK